MLSIGLKAALVLWWLLNIIWHLQNTEQFTTPPRTANWGIFCKYLRFIELTTFQFAVGALGTGLFLRFILRKPLYPEEPNKISVKIAVLSNVLGSLAVNATYFMHTWHVREILRSWEPLVMFSLLIVLNYLRPRKHHDLKSMVIVGILIMAMGFCLSVGWNKPFSEWAVVAAVVSAISSPMRNLFLKDFGDSCVDPLQKYSIISTYGLLLLLPVVLLKLAYTQIVPVIKVGVLFESASFHVTDALLSIIVLENICPLFHAVLGPTIHMSVTIATLIYTRTPSSWNTFVGLAVFMLGLMLYIGKTVTRRENDLKRSILCVSLVLYALLSVDLLIHMSSHPTSDSSSSSANSTIRTFWVLNQPPADDVIENIITFHAKLPSEELHVYCMTSSCTEKIRHLQNPRIVASFLTLNDILQDSPLEQWFSRHSLHKILSGKYFQDHLHEAGRLALVWHYGGIVLDPFLRIDRIPFLEFRTVPPWVSSISDTGSYGILHACNFLPKHPFIKKLANLFLTQYEEACTSGEHSRKFVSQFDHVSLKALTAFCQETKTQCPKVIEFKDSHVTSRKGKETRHFGIITGKSEIDFSLAYESFASAQFLPFADLFFESYHLYKTKVERNATVFVTRDWTYNERARQFLEIVDPIILSVSVDFPKTPRLEYIDYLRRRAPVGCLDAQTVKFLRKNNVTSYFTGGMSLLVKSRFLSRIPRRNVYLVDVSQEVREKLPQELKKIGIILDQRDTNKLNRNRRSWLKAVYDLIEKYATARLVVTQDIDCALVATAMGTPTLFVNSSAFLGISGQVRNPKRLGNVPEIVHVWDFNRTSKNDIDKFMADFRSGTITSNPDPSVFMRSKATAWNVIRRRESLRDSSLSFGVAPFPRPISLFSNTLTFHLIFTTSGQNSIALGGNSGDSVKGSFTWRHWRCIEAIFFHHPFARVIVHSNTLGKSTFDVLTEAGYDILVEPYDLVDMAAGTPVAKFVREELAYAREGQYWYSHETDLLRVLILFKKGGIYMDTDVIVVRSLSDLPRNVLGWESSAKLNGAFMKFERGHPFLAACLRKFSQHYSQSWAENGPLLITRVWREWTRSHIDSDVSFFPSEAFYMFAYLRTAKECFEDTSGYSYDNKWKILREEAYVVHLYSKVTAKYGTRNSIKENTLCKHILNSFCVLCDRIY